MHERGSLARPICSQLMEYILAVRNTFFMKVKGASPRDCIEFPEQRERKKDNAIMMVGHFLKPVFSYKPPTQTFCVDSLFVCFCCEWKEKNKSSKGKNERDSPRDTCHDILPYLSFWISLLSGLKIIRIFSTHLSLSYTLLLFNLSSILALTFKSYIVFGLNQNCEEPKTR